MLNVAAARFGAQSQLFRLTYPAGSTTRLTNDPNDYAGISLTSDRSSLVTARRDARMDVWVGDGGAAAGTDVVQRAPVSSGGVAWSGERLLYGGLVGGRPAILRVTPGEGTSEEVLVDAALAGGHERWQYDRVRLGIQQRPKPLDRGCQRSPDRPTGALQPWLCSAVVTPNDRSVLYRSAAGGTCVNLDGAD